MKQVTTLTYSIFIRCIRLGIRWILFGESVGTKTKNYSISGQVLTVIYSCIGIPLMLVVLGDVGNLVVRVVTITYAFLLIKIRRFFARKVEPQNMDESFELPLYVALFVIIVYVLICSAVVHYFDYKEGVYDGLPIWESIYFSSISFLTIGLGDVMPNNIHVSFHVISFRFLKTNHFIAFEICINLCIPFIGVSF